MSATASSSPSGPSRDELRSRWRLLHNRIAARAATEVQVVAVTKGFPAEVVRAAVEAGITDFGENYAQELVAKAEALRDRPEVRWHAIGKLQRNKVKRLAPHVDLWQTVDRAAVGAEIARWSPGAPVLVQVNISGEATKGGAAPGDVARLVDHLRSNGLDVRGLMGIGPLGAPDEARVPFRELVRLADRLELAERSLGMSADLDVAVEEGATIVRVGRALFGARPT